MSEATASSSDKDGDTETATSSGDAPSTITSTDANGHKTVTVVSTSGEGHHHGYWSESGGFHSWMGIFVLVILAGIIKTAIRARHGDTRTNRQRRRDERAGIGFVAAAANRENEALAEENAKLRAQASRMEERIAVLERIVTDPAKRVSDEIDALR